MLVSSTLNLFKPSFSDERGQTVEIKVHLQVNYVYIHVYAHKYGGVRGVSLLFHRLQLSQNLRDSPGFSESAPGPGRRYYRSWK